VDILEKLADLHKQATTENSHYYVAGCCEEAMNEIRYLRWQRDKKDKPLITVGPRKGEMDFGVSLGIVELTSEQMRDLRAMICVAIGQAERIWLDAQERKHPASTARG
jgi:hypothetical protein